jgi:hypothetical protein
MIFSERWKIFLIMLIRKITMALLAGLVLVAFNSCQKENTSGTTNLRVRLTDNPFNATEVNVDIREVRVNMADDSTDWVSLNTAASVYNLLGLQNGVDTVLATGIIPTGVLKEVRFVLGNDNSIVIDSTEYPLTIPSGTESGLKIKVNRQLNASIDSLLIDFDAALSIIKTGNGEYKLKPVLKLK